MPNGGRIECRIYIGNLPPHVRTKDLEDIFFKYGSIAFIDIKNNDRGTPFAFIEFEDARDADDAVQSRDGYNFDGYRLRVEYCRGGRGAGRYIGFKDDQRYRSRRSGPPSRRSQYRVTVTDLPPSGSWQDLKDHMREAGDVCYADVYKDGTGVVEFLRFDDMKYAVRKLNDTKFRSHEGEISYIHVKADPKFDRRLSRSRSVSYNGRRPTPCYSPIRDSRSRS